MVTVFIPSSPTAVAGYVVVAHRDQVVELPLTVEEALRLLISGGVLMPNAAGAAGTAAKPAEGNVVPGVNVVVGSRELPGMVPVPPGAPLESLGSQATAERPAGKTSAA
jgi:hypothetical protein